LHYWDKGGRPSGPSLMDGIEEFLRLLEDGRWHRLESLALKQKWTMARTRRLAEFLWEHGLVHFRSRDETVRIDIELQALLKET